MNNIINSSGIYDITSYNLTSNNATILSTLNVSGTTTLNNVIINGSFNSNNSINSNTTINGTLNVSGTTSLRNTTTISSSLNVSGTTTLNNVTTINSSLNVSGTTRLNNTTTINSSLNVSGTTTLNNNSTVVGTLNILGYTNIRSYLEVLEDIKCNNITCASSVVIGNTIYCNNLTNNTGETINFNIDSSTNYYPNICTINSTETKINNSLNVSGITKLNNITTINSSLNVSGLTTLNNTTTINSSLNVSGLTTLNNTTTINSSLNVSGTTRLNNTTTINSSLNVSGTTTLNNNTTINSTLDVVNKTTTQDLQVKGILTLPVNNWIIDSNSNVTNNQRMYFDSGAKTYFKSGGTSTSPLLDGFIFRNGQAGTDLLNIDGSGNSTQLGTLLVRGITCMSTLNVSGITILNGNVGIGTNDPKTLLHVNGKTLIHNGVGLAPTNGTYGNDGTRIILWPGADNNTPYSLGIAGGVLWYTVPTGANHVFYVGTTERTRINTSGFVGINTNDPKCHLQVNGIGNINNGSASVVQNGYMASGSLTIGGTSANYGGGNLWNTNTAGLLMECLDNTEIAVHDSQLRVASLMYYEGGVNNYKITIGRDMGWNAVSNVVINGNVGIQNTSPWVDLNLGNVAVSGSSGSLVFGKNNGAGGIRNFRQGMSSNFFFCIGDCSNVNNSSAVWTLQSAISYQAPASSFTISSTGTIIMPYSWNSSDERIKTNVKTIEYALDKVLLLRGVEYNDFRYEPDKKHIGLIAQEVELIIPEAVGINEFDNIKCISYNSIIGVLVEAVKQLNNKVLNLENIIKNNNLS